MGLGSEQFLTGDRSWPAAEEREDVQLQLGNAIAFLLRTAFVDAVDNERCQTHHSEPDGANDHRILAHDPALLSLERNSLSHQLLHLSIAG